MLRAGATIQACILVIFTTGNLGGFADETSLAPARHAPRYDDHARLLVVRDGGGKERPVGDRAGWDVRRAHIVASFQEVAGPLPGGERRVPLDMAVLATFYEKRLVRKKITFDVEPGDRVPAWLIHFDDPLESTFRHPAVLCLHQTIAMGKDEPAGLGSNPDLKYGLELAERGYVTLCPDYPNFGDYRVDVYNLGYQSATMKAVWNNLRAVDLLCSLKNVDRDRIGVIGHSLGGHNAIFTAIFEPRIKAVVSSCGFNAFASYFRGNIAGWSHNGYMPRLRDVYRLDLKQVPFDFPELIGALAPRPFFANSPLHDANFDVQGVRACIDAARPVYELFGVPENLRVFYPDAQHNFPKEARTRAYDFLDRYVKQTSQSGSN